MSTNFNNKVAVITGGNSGIGYATAKEFIERGATVIITGRRKDALDKAAAELGAIPVVAEQSNLADLDRLVTSVQQQYGTVDFLFINAGINSSGNAIEHNTETAFDQVMNINFKGAYFTLSKFIPILKDGASVVFLSSVAASVSTRTLSDYAASKAALNSTAKTAALELAPRKIRVNIVSPGPTVTDIMNKPGMDPELAKQMFAYIQTRIPLDRLGQAYEIAKSVVHLCEDSSGFITGAELLIDGGYQVNN
jgi:NAD(P)-dependent dehydrogenase (short-subunit alcohol dehydrogenase family)